MLQPHCGLPFSGSGEGKIFIHMPTFKLNIEEMNKNTIYLKTVFNLKQSSLSDVSLARDITLSARTSREVSIQGESRYSLQIIISKRHL